jgi:protease I
METQLAGKKIAILATDGVEQVELLEPRRALESAGAVVELLAPKPGDIQAMDHVDRAGRLPVDRAVYEADPAEYDGLVLPGGVRNGDRLRTDHASVEFVRAFLIDGVPIGVICHGGWILIETGAIAGRTLTSYSSLQTDLRNAGAQWVDEEVHNDRGLVSSRRPGDLPAFCAKLIEEIAEGRHGRQAA